MWSHRFAAAILDSLLVFGILVLTIIFAIPVGMHPIDGLGVGALLGLLSYLGPMLRRDEHTGQTLGKQALDIRVARDDGRPVGVGTAIGRDMIAKPALTVVTLGVDLLWPLGEREGRALHDLLARTHVVAGAPELPPPLALQGYVDAARAIQADIADPAVRREVTALVGEIEDSARRAQPLYTALAQRPVAGLERRLAEVADKPELRAALETQLPIQRRLADQVERYRDELERVVVELDTVRAALLTAAAVSDDHGLLAERVRDLRDDMVAVSEGFGEAYGG